MQKRGGVCRLQGGKGEKKPRRGLRRSRKGRAERSEGRHDAEHRPCGRTGLPGTVWVRESRPVPRRRGRHTAKSNGISPAKPCGL